MLRTIYQLPELAVALNDTIMGYPKLLQCLRLLELMDNSAYNFWQITQTSDESRQPTTEEIFIFFCSRRAFEETFFDMDFVTISNAPEVLIVKVGEFIFVQGKGI